MNFDRLKQISDDLRDARRAIADVKIALRERIGATEVKFDPNQPRAPKGTPTGGQWTNIGRGSGQSASGRKRSPPLIAGAVGIQRAAGTYASAVSGQPMTPFLHIPYQKPTVGSLPAPRGRAVRRRAPSRSVLVRNQGSLDRQCEIKLDEDLLTCSLNAATYGRASGTERAIYAICKETAMHRYGECRAGGGGIHAIRTPLYRGHNYRGG